MNFTVLKAAYRMAAFPSAARNNPFVHGSGRSISSRSARQLLGLPSESIESQVPVSLRELRHAYFGAAKRCHPDTKAETESVDFLQITRAYEVLRKEIRDGIVEEEAITNDEEDEFRRACQSWLGVKAEIVEECKQNPIFRKWLSGRTDAASHWRMFFVQNGGLAPKLRPTAGHITAKDGVKPPAHTTRRRRK